MVRGAEEAGIREKPVAKVWAFRFGEEKRRLVEALFHDRPIRFVQNMGWRLADYPESRERAAAALETARRKPRTAWLAAVRRTILRLQYNAMRHAFERRPEVGAVVWNGLVSTRNIFMSAARDAGNATLYLELGPFPGTLTVDPRGVNFANSLPRDGDAYRRWAVDNPDELGVWRPLAERLVGRAPAKVRGDTTGHNLPSLEEPFIFVPLQKQGDTQLRVFGERCRTVDATVDMLLTAADALPPGWHLRIKEHPTDRPRVAKRAVELVKSRIHLDNGTETFTQVRAARAVLTVNSSVGLEAMLLEKPVIAMGRAFWALPGLAASAETPAKLRDCLGAVDRFAPDAELRNAFLSFLVAAYYPLVPINARGEPSLEPQTRIGLLRRMTSGSVL